MVLHSYPTPFAIVPAGTSVYPIYNSPYDRHKMPMRTLTRAYAVHCMDNKPSYIGVKRRGRILPWPMAMFDLSEPVPPHLTGIMGPLSIEYTIAGFLFDPKYCDNPCVLIP